MRRPILITALTLLCLLASGSLLAQEVRPTATMSAEDYLNQGFAHYKQGEYQAAIAAYDLALARDSSLIEGYYNRALAHYHLGDWEAAIADYDRMIAVDPDYVLAYGGRGAAYYNLGDLDAALADYDLALKLDPDLATVYSNRAVVYIRQDELESALADFDQAIALEPELAQAYENRGLTYAIMGEWDTAIADYDRAIALEADAAGAYLGRAIAHTGQGDTADAARDFWQWVKLIQTEIVEMEAPSWEEPVNIEMQTGTVYRIPFEAQSGQIVTVTANAETIGTVDPLLVILDAGDEALIADNDSGINTDAIIRDFVPPEDGTYILVVSHATGGSEGMLEITLSVTNDS